MSPSCEVSKFENGLKVKQLTKQLPTLKTLMQTILDRVWVKNFTFSILCSMKLNFSTQLFLAQLNYVQWNSEKLLILHIVAFMLGPSKWLWNCQCLGQIS